MYSGTVHNFMVGDDGDAAEGTANMYANGILVGDLASQQHYTQRRKLRVLSFEELKKETPVSWHTDLESYYKSKK